ncbi:MAG TPA: uracil-DNA glycosylase family protein [Polyangia bacterium]
MGKPVVTGRPVVSPIVFVGQAPGDKEPVMGKPFAWTAGRNLFKWFGTLGVDEETFRDNVYMAAVCRCFPGKNPKGGDRVPSDEEIENCAPWLERELEICRPELIIPVGKLAIARFLADAPLAETIGRVHTWKHAGRAIDVIPLPHPSGASTWYHVEPGKTLTREALALIGKHRAWAQIRGGARRGT